MSLSDCSECWDTPCTCGYGYRHWSIKQLEDQIDMLQKVMIDKKQTQQMSEENKEEEPQKEIVPYSEAKLEKHRKKFMMASIEVPPDDDAPGKRVVTVGLAVDGSGHRTIECLSDTLDGKTSKLEFALSRGGSYALLRLLLSAQVFDDEMQETKNTEPPTEE